MKEEKDHDEFVLPLDNFPSRTSSLSCSSRLYYYSRATEGVPFQWEMQPGTPKNIPPLTVAIPPPISPPPAALSLRLPKPTRALNKQPLCLLFGPWRKQSKSKSKSKKHACPSDEFEDGRSRFGSCGFHCEFMESPCEPNSSSSWSSSSSSLLSLPPSLPPEESPGHQRLGCGPWRINPIKIAIGRRV